MTGSAKHTRKGQPAPASHTPNTCAITTCHEPAAFYCYECDQRYCALHLTSVSLTTTTRCIYVRVCPDCLHRYRIDPDIERLLRLEPSRLN